MTDLNNKPRDYTFEVEEYLAKQGEKFREHFDANWYEYLFCNDSIFFDSYLLLSRSMDLMDLGRNLSSIDEGIKRIKAPTLIVSFER